ncbi:hypothetical protein ACHAXS_010842 [Conticribra weissflogii]
MDAKDPTIPKRCGGYRGGGIFRTNRGFGWESTHDVSCTEETNHELNLDGERPDDSLDHIINHFIVNKVWMTTQKSGKKKGRDEKKRRQKTKRMTDNK